MTVVAKVFKQKINQLNSKSTAQDFVAIIDELKANFELNNAKNALSILSEQHPFYKGKSTHHMILYRGYAMEAFMHSGLPDKALPYLLEELETSFYPYMVAAAARAMRGMEQSMPQLAPFLIKGYYNIWKGDEVMDFSQFRNEAAFDPANITSATKEIFLTIKWLGNDAIYILPELQHIESHQAKYFEVDVQETLIETIQHLENLEQPVDDCCNLPMEIYNQREEIQDDLNEGIRNIELEDQEGNTILWKDFFQEKYTVLSFFYSRCHNPRKCTQTIYNLVDLQEILTEKGLDVKTAAISYDPTYDQADILKAYGKNRKFHFSEDNRMFRTLDGIQPLMNSLKLGVNFKGNVVNIHRVEVYIINPNGEIVQSFLRFQAKPELIAEEIERVINGKEIKVNQEVVKSRTQTISTVIFPVLVAFFPKCPMCWASYLSLLGVTGLSNIPYSPWLLSVFTGIALINLLVLFKRARLRNGLTPFYLATVGTFILVLNYWFQFDIMWSIFGIFILSTSSLLNSLSFSKYNQFKLFLNEKKYKILN